MSPPIGGMTWSRSFMLVRFQICFMMARSSSLAFSKLPVQNSPVNPSTNQKNPTMWICVPSVLILRAVRTRANRVALKVTVPSLFRGMFIPTSRYTRSVVTAPKKGKPKSAKQRLSHGGAHCCMCTLHAARWGQNLPKPSGGWMRRSKVTTSRCLILPLWGQTIIWSCNERSTRTRWRATFRRTWPQGHILPRSS